MYELDSHTVRVQIKRNYLSDRSTHLLSLLLCGIQVCKNQIPIQKTKIVTALRDAQFILSYVFTQMALGVKLENVYSFELISAKYDNSRVPFLKLALRFIIQRLRVIIEPLFFTIHLCTFGT